MQLLPSVIFRTDTSDGERRVRSLVEKLAGSDGAFALHSLNLPDHEYKRYSEADFVLVDERGLIVLEAKGGTVKCEGGEWSFENGRGGKRSKSEGPHQQAESAVQAVRTMLRKNDARYQPSVFGWAVVFPFTHWTQDHPEIPAEIVVDASDCEDAVSFTKAIDRVFRYWRQRSVESGRTIYPIEVDDYAHVLVPEFQYVPSPAKCAEAVWEDVVRLSSKQCEILEGLGKNPRLLVNGGAGTGKTVLANAAAKKASSDGKRTALIIGAPLLAAALSEDLVGVLVCPADRISELPTSGFDVVVVDEGQELATSDGLAQVDRILKGGLSGGSWRWFMDADNQSLHNDAEPAALTRLEDLAMQWSPKRNVRSTKEIVALVQEALGADIGLSEIDGRGVRPLVQVMDSDQAALEWVGNFVAQKVKSGVDPRHLVVLGAPDELSKIRNSIHTLSDRDAIIVTGPDQLHQMKSRLVVSDPSTFRGLERAWTVVVCTKGFSLMPRPESYLYVAMTRSNAGLAIALGPDGKVWLEQLYQDQMTGKGRRA
ncbi:nuclease-related domain-containing DEAD/DEAH box helicase [Sphingomonas sp. Leaf38]|uniref:nuclease-related domain-containing DEAD/DEAH box helicase n=1 Tax=Sphingomonas sp. Leaf38 TaxID=1736217 RepID=UPI0009E97BAE|nr:nuclease-related domain-containing protein [Sphingomonas sp. Leaf38]